MQRTLFAAVALLVAIGWLSVGSASAATISLNAVRDNTLHGRDLITDPQLSNALGDIFVGRTGQSGTASLRRGLVAFDLSAIPAGSVITSATLTMYINRTQDTAAPWTITLHEVTANWGEGTSFFNGGQGAPATTNDATWFFSLFNGTT